MDMRYRVADLKGIPFRYRWRLNSIKIRYVDQLLTAFLPDLGKQSHIPISALERYRNCAELLQLPSIGPVYTAWLTSTDIRLQSIAELARSDPRQLFTQISQIQKNCISGW